MKLVYKKTGVEVKEGDKVKTSRDEDATVEFFRPPHKPSSEGKISIMIGDFNEEVYVGVIGAEWIERQDQMLGLGTISHGTMRSRHLIPRFMEALESVDPEECIVIRDEYKAVFEMLDSGDDPEIGSLSEECNDLVNERLFDTLNQWVPPFTCFSSHPGDGADFGVWFCEESYMDAVKEGRILEIEGVDNWPKDLEEKVEYVAIRYNNTKARNEYPVALYDLHKQQIWSI